MIHKIFVWKNVCYITFFIGYITSYFRVFTLEKSYELSKIHKRSLTTMRMDSPEFRNLFTRELNTLWNMFLCHGYDIRIVGGAVRDLISGIAPHDLDLATTATPEQMKAMFYQENVRTFNQKGELHGTVTARINKENFEITTLRTDVSTDGRHAEVEYTTNWEVDANRRDLTINALYLGLDGTVYDYFGGIEDLKNRRVLFVGDPGQRIREDYLRILRYFRFFGRVVDNPNTHDERTLRATQENARGLERISGERIWSELQRILTGRFAVELINVMLDVGLGNYLAFGPREKLDMKALNDLCLLKQKYEFKPTTFIGVLLPNQNQILAFHERMKLSTEGRNLALFINEHKNDSSEGPPENPLRPFQEIAIKTHLSKSVVREYIKEFFRMKDRPDLVEKFTAWKEPIMPVNGKILQKRGVKNGSLMGFLIKELRDIWIQSDFEMTEEQLLRKIPEISDKFVG